MTEKKRPVGRPKTGENTTRNTVWQTKERWAKAKRIGKGKHSRGIRIAIDRFEEEQ